MAVSSDPDSGITGKSFSELHSHTFVQGWPSGGEYKSESQPTEYRLTELPDASNPKPNASNPKPMDSLTGDCLTERRFDVGILTTGLSQLLGNLTNVDLTGISRYSPGTAAKADKNARRQGEQVRDPSSGRKAGMPEEENRVTTLVTEEDPVMDSSLEAEKEGNDTVSLSAVPVNEDGQVKDSVPEDHPSNDRLRQCSAGGSSGTGSPGRGEGRAAPNGAGSVGNIEKLNAKKDCDRTMSSESSDEEDEESEENEESEFAQGKDRDAMARHQTRYAYLQRVPPFQLVDPPIGNRTSEDYFPFLISAA
jgi:hypothetical protein